MIRLVYCLGVKSVVSIKETIMYQLEASKKNPKSSQSLQREGDEQVLHAIPSSTISIANWDISNKLQHDFSVIKHACPHKSKQKKNM